MEPNEIEKDIEISKPKKKRISSRNLMKINYYGPIEKRLTVTENKIEKMKFTIEQELKRIEMEWLHLKGMMTKIESSAKDQESSAPEINLDDASQINEEECDFAINTDNPLKIPYSESESEISDNNFSDGEDYSNANVFI